MSFRYELNNKFNFTNVLGSILESRGISDIRKFLSPDESCLEDESLFDNIGVAANTLLEHIQNDKDISIVVDCDADGFTSASMMYQYIEELIVHFNSKTKLYYVVHDDKKHGLDKTTVDNLEKQNTDLIIIPDAGSNDYDQHEYLYSKSKEIIVLDHHECDKYSKYAIVVNNQLSSKITNKAMTGAGVVYKFIRYIDKILKLNTANQYLDLVSIGMIADSCDLRNLESRYLTLQGLKQIENDKNNNKLIKSMISKKSFDMKGKVTITGISFYIAPLINSIIRNGTLCEKELMFKAFINSNETYTDKIRGKGEVELSIQDYVVRIAEKCKRKQNKLIKESIEKIEKQIEDYGLNDNGLLIVSGTDIVDPNYTGLIANKLTSLYQKPCLVLRGDGEKLSGSGRGFDKKEIKDLRKWCIETRLFELAEGHPNAFGVKIHKDNTDKLYYLASEVKDSDELLYFVDGVFTDKTLNKYIIQSVSEHGDIWGTTVSEPVFAIKDININTKDIQLMGSKLSTIKFKYKDIEFIKFKSNEEEFNEITKYKNINLTLIGKFGMNTYNGGSTPQIIIENMKYEKGVSKFIF